MPGHLHPGRRGNRPDRPGVGESHRRRARRSRATGTRRSRFRSTSRRSQLTDAWLAQRIVRLLTETGFPAERLVVEITESSLFADMDLARSIVTSLKNQGIQLALDDFGTGFSSLVAPALAAVRHDQDRPQLRRQHPFQQGKHGDRPRRDDAGRARSRVPVCVEGIEDEAAHAAVLRLGCAGRPGLVFRQADAGRLRRAGCSPSASQPDRPRRPHSRQLAPNSPRLAAFRPALGRRSRMRRCRRCKHGKSNVKKVACGPRATLSQLDPRRFGRRAIPHAARGASAAVTLSDDLRLFAVTFAPASCSSRSCIA